MSSDIQTLPLESCTGPGLNMSWLCFKVIEKGRHVRLMDKAVKVDTTQKLDLLICDSLTVVLVV